jgi:protein-S-isoprenylcysteine O-methyltransferase Ste14
MQYLGVVVLHGSATSWLRQSGVLDLPGVKPVLLGWLLERTITVISLVRRINQEEEVVKSMFGDEWRTWAKNVRYRLIPGIY